VSGYGVIFRAPIFAGGLAKRLGGLTGNDCRVLLVICAHVRNGTWQAHPAVTTIARLTKLTERSIRRCILRLAKRGWLTVSTGGGRTHTNVYTLNQNPDTSVTLPPAETLTDAARNPDTGAQETLTLARTHNRTTTRTPREQRTAAPPADSTKGKINRLMAQWADGFKGRTGGPLASSARGRVAGTLKRLTAEHPTADLTAAIEAWFSINRQSYSPGLFARKIEDGDADLAARSAGGYQDNDPSPEEAAAFLKGMNP
jgi:hypothetical protein